MSWVEQMQRANWSQITVLAAAAYVLGCFATGYYLVRAFKGMDIRDVDSGSVGARNVSQIMGRLGFVITTLGDISKGALAVFAARHLTNDIQLVFLAMVAVTAGHIWPAQLRFRGGKGVATSLGALLLCDWQLVVTYLVVFCGGLVVTRKTILPGLFGYICLPFATFWLHRNGLLTGLMVVLGAMVLFAHRRNIVEEFPCLAARCGVAAKPEQPKL